MRVGRCCCSTGRHRLTGGVRRRSRRRFATPFLELRVTDMCGQQGGQFVPSKSCAFRPGRAVSIKHREPRIGIIASMIDLHVVCVLIRFVRVVGIKPPLCPLRVLVWLVVRYRLRNAVRPMEDTGQWRRICGDGNLATYLDFDFVSGPKDGFGIRRTVEGSAGHLFWQQPTGGIQFRRLKTARPIVAQRQQPFRCGGNLSSCTATFRRRQLDGLLAAHPY